MTQAKRANPKTHDALFKWLITSFTEEFFAHYFPDIQIGKYAFMDKEFLSKYESLKESLKGDLFLIMEAEVDGDLRELVIQIEHMSERKDMGRRVCEYACHAWLLKGLPVWSMVIYTDDAIWRKPVPDRFWNAFDSVGGKQHLRFDVIKINREKSRELIRRHSMLCKLLALKADDRDADPEKLIREIFRAAVRRKEELSDDQLLLMDRWVGAYKKISDHRLDSIRKETEMEFVETTISEHIRNQGRLEGKIEGRLEGKTEGRLEGKIEGKIEALENLYMQGILSKEQFEAMAAPLRLELARLLAETEKSKDKNRLQDA